jgi:hypothetical protein
MSSQSRDAPLEGKAMNHRTQIRAERTSPRHRGARLYTAVLAACLAISAFGASTAAASHARNGLNNAEALQALKVRSIALNQRYHLGRADTRTEHKASAATRVRFVRISDFVRGIRIARNASAATRVRFVRISDFVRSIRIARNASAATRVRFVRISDFVRGIRIARNASAATRVRFVRISDFVRSSDVRCPCNADLPRGWAG